MTENETIQAALARCIVEPDFLDLLDGTLTRPEWTSLDYDRLRRFAGFVTKVQNNHLWEYIPLTRALLRYYDLEIRAFSLFRREHQRIRKASNVSQVERVRSFVQMFGLEVDRFAAVAPGLADVFTHERAHFELRYNAPRDNLARVRLSQSRTCEEVSQHPSVRGDIRIGYFNSDPFQIATMLATGAFHPDKITTALMVLGYWRPPMSDTIHVLHMSHATAVLLGYINGERTILDIVKCSRADLPADIEESDLVQFFEQATAQGLLWDGE